MLGLFKKKDDSLLWKDLMKIIEVVQTKLVKLEAEVEQINGKLRKKIYKEEGFDPEYKKSDKDSGRYDSKSNDGLDGVREMQRNLNAERFGI